MSTPRTLRFVPVAAAVLASMLPVADLALTSAQTMGKPQPKTQRERMLEEDPDLARYIEVTSPGSEHDPLRRLVGMWNAELKVWGGKGEQALEGEGRTVNRMILGGRFLQSTFRGDIEGGEFIRFGIDGYDKLAKKFTSSWVDNQSTAIHSYEGSVSSDGKTITMTSRQIDPESGKSVGVTSRTTLVDGDTYRYETWAQEEGSEQWKMMEIVFVREKDETK
jgi:hypothetical protein